MICKEKRNGTSRDFPPLSLFCCLEYESDGSSPNSHCGNLNHFLEMLEQRAGRNLGQWRLVALPQHRRTESEPTYVTRQSLDV